VVRLALCIAAASLVGACASLPEPGKAPPGGFEISGRAAISSARNSGSVRFFWRHSDDADEMLVTSPVGQGVARITRERDLFRLVTGDRKEYAAADAESLTDQALGWRLPLSGLPDWVRARASPGRPSTVTGEPGGGLEIRQDGWRVAYEEFRGGRPFRMRLSRDDLEIRLVLDQWTD
jgi:outer membrane lipoprotein LolB